MLGCAGSTGHAQDSGGIISVAAEVFVPAMQGPIRSTAVKELQFAAATSLPDAVNKAFSTLPVLVDARGFELNVSMAGNHHPLHCLVKAVCMWRAASACRHPSHL